MHHHRPAIAQSDNPNMGILPMHIGVVDHIACHSLATTKHDVARTQFIYWQRHPVDFSIIAATISRNDNNER